MHNEGKKITKTEKNLHNYVKNILRKTIQQNSICSS